MRAGWATATNKRRGHFFVGYDLHIVVPSRSIGWQGNPRNYQVGPKVELYVLGMVLVPAGTNPGPAGYDAVMKARAIAPRIREVVADRAYTVKREKFLRPLHKEKINVVMDYPKAMVVRSDPITLGKREQPAIMNAGTIMPNWVSPDRYTLPEDLHGQYPPDTGHEGLTKEQKKELREGKLYRWLRQRAA